MKNRVITISREFGSGGRTIGKQVAAELGIPCYDNELLPKLLRRAVSMKTMSKKPENTRPADFWPAHFPTEIPVPTMPTISGQSNTESSRNWLKRAPVSS